MPIARAFTAEQSRQLVNLRQRYEVWRDAECELARLPYDLRRKTVNGRTYLYRIFDRGGNGKSLRPMDAANARQFGTYHPAKTAPKARIAGLSWRVAEGIPPSALSDPYVKLSLHTAPIRQTCRSGRRANVQKDLCSCERAVPGSGSLGSCGL
ncbi:hypothetical protein [Novosphingobium sp. KN65.2]|uniref:hypothetical protein n=1 Tax=Novosphingobium sp. KN65.2 TaxID=1478134 RepID=UPI0005E91F6E|nr:hypothetical protein [Novosphingobium sp. KN65.2]CDO35939.1 hypothetical protein SPHV1_2280083 [Novosphingobium sp. KN65.2]